WIYACADARIEKRVFMELGANTTYALLRGGGPVTLELKVLVNYRDYHAGRRMANAGGADPGRAPGGRLRWRPAVRGGGQGGRGECGAHVVPRLSARGGGGPRARRPRGPPARRDVPTPPRARGGVDPRPLHGFRRGGMGAARATRSRPPGDVGARPAA